MSTRKPVLPVLALLAVLCLPFAAAEDASEDACVRMTEKSASFHMVSTHRCACQLRIENLHGEKTVSSFELQVFTLDSGYRVVREEPVQTVRVTVRPKASRLMPKVYFTADTTPAYIVFRVLSVSFSDGTRDARPGRYKVFAIR